MWSSPTFLSSCYPRASRHLIANFVKDIRKLSIGLVPVLYVAFGPESFVKGPVVLFTQELPDPRLDGLLTLIVLTYGRLGELFVLLRYPEQLQGSSREFDAQMETASYRKLKDWRILLLQFLLQQVRSLTGEDKLVSNENDARVSRHAGEGVQTLGPVREPCISSGLFRAELGGTTGTAKTAEQG